MNLSLKLFIIFLFPFYINGQSTLSFESPDTVCVGEEFEIINKSENIISTNWNFCDLSFLDTPTGDIVQGINDLTKPVFIEIEKDNGNYFGFVSNNHGSTTLFNQGTIVRLDFGNSLLNTPTETNLGNLNTLISRTEAIQIVNDNGNWWGFVIGGIKRPDLFPDLIRLNFGNSLSNIPTATSLGDIGDLSFPHDLLIFKENEDWYGWTINNESNSITRFSFGNSLANTPTGENLGNIGELDVPTGFFHIYDGVEWFIFVINKGSQTVSRLEFGEELSNTPFGVNIGNLSVLQVPRDIVITKSCETYHGFVLDSMLNFIRLEFGNDLTSIPVPTVLENPANLVFPHSFSNPQIIDGESFFFIPNVGNHSLSRVVYDKCTQANPNTSNQFSPPPISYDQTGTYVIRMTTDIGLPTQNSICKEIVVVPPPDINLGKDTTLCASNNLILNTSYENSIWQNEFIDSTFEVVESGWVQVEAYNDYCSTPGIDSILVDYLKCDDCLKLPNAFTPDQDNINDLYYPVLDCETIFQSYSLSIYNRWGEKVFSTSDLLTGWDGKHNNKNATSDIYIWTVNYSYFNGEEIISKNSYGDLTLIR